MNLSVSLSDYAIPFLTMWVGQTYNLFMQQTS